MGLVTQSRLDRLNEKLNYVEKLTQFFNKTSAIPEEINILDRLRASQISQKMKLIKLVSRPQVDFSSIEHLQSIQTFLLENGKDNEAIEQTIIQIKYSGYINREKENAKRSPGSKILPYLKILNIKSSHHFLLRQNKSWAQFVQKQLLPEESLGCLRADISVLLVYMGR